MLINVDLKKRYYYQQDQMDLWEPMSLLPLVNLVIIRLKTIVGGVSED